MGNWWALRPGHPRTELASALSQEPALPLLPGLRPTMRSTPPICGSKANRISRNIAKSSGAGRSMPRDKALALVDKTEGAAAYIVIVGKDEKLETAASKRFRQYLNE